MLMDYNFGEPTKKNIIPDIQINMDDFIMDNDVFIEEEEEDVGSQNSPKQEFDMLETVSEI